MALNKISLIGLLLFSNILLLTAQVDSKYLEGAVPIVDGKVLFTREIKVSTTVPNDQLYTLAKSWAYQQFPENNASKQRVLLTDEAESYIVAQGDERLVFKSQIFMLDQTEISYQLVLRTERGKCTLQVRNIRYDYQDYDKQMMAEDMISDKVALHKSGEKLNRHYDKFRTFTIDRVDELRSSLIMYLGQVSVQEMKIKEEKAASIVDDNELPQPAPSIKVEGSPAVSIAQPMAVSDASDMQSTPMIPLTPATKADGMVGYKQMNADQISENILKMFKDSRAVVVAGKDSNVQVMTGVWSGTGNFGGKPVAMTFVNVGSNSSKEDMYTISFFTEVHGDALDKMAEIKVSDRTKVATGLTPLLTPNGATAFGEAWMIIECKKQTEQDSSESAMDENAQSKKWRENINTKLFMGEIINVWAR